MSRRDKDNFSTPPSSVPESNEGRTPSTSSQGSPPTPLSEEPSGTRRPSGIAEPILPAPNERRRPSAGGVDYKEPNPANRDPISTIAQMKDHIIKLQGQEQAYEDKIRKLEQEKAKLIARAPDPKYVTELETQNQDLYESNLDLSTQIDTVRIENKKHSETIQWQKREIDHLSKDCQQNSAAIKAVAGVQRGQIDTKNIELREQLDAAMEDNAQWYEKCSALEQEIDRLKSENGITTTIADREKLIKINKDVIFRDEELLSFKMNLMGLHDDLDQIRESKMTRKGSMLFDEDLAAELDAKQHMIEDLKAQISRQQEQIEELSIERGFSGAPNLKDELGTSSVASTMDEITPYHNELQKELKHVKEQLEDEKANTKKLISCINTLNQPASKTGVSKALIPKDLQPFLQPIEDTHRDTDHSTLGDTIVPSNEESKPQLEGNSKESEDPKSWSEWGAGVFCNLYEGLGSKDDDIVWSSFSSTNSTKTVRPSHADSIPTIYLQVSHRIWTEMICAGSEYFTKVDYKGQDEWVRVKGPLWWSLIIQLLIFMLVPSVAIAWWCIMTASAERELWLAANEITIKKYWDTTVWGAERDLLWRLCYGLGLV